MVERIGKQINRHFFSKLGEGGVLNPRVQSLVFSFEP